MRKKIEIIAEVAQGYEGDKKLTSLLTKGAIASNVDAIKFQLVYADELATPDYKHYQLFKSLEMEKSIWMDICAEIQDNGIRVYFDVFGQFSLQIAKDVGADGIKLSTTEFYNNNLFDSSISQFDLIYLSVGGIPIEDIDKKLSTLNLEQANKICLMYGLQAEPTPLNQNNLNKLKLFKKRYPDHRIGFMDHSDGGTDDAFHLPLVALGVGVDVIEKHITLDRELEIEDYISGLTPTAFVKFVALIRKFESTLGLNSLKLASQEEEYRNKATKVVVALRNFKSGDIITLDSIALKRSSRAITENSILEIEQVVGKKLLTDIQVNMPIIQGDV
jgi:N,N'-diacetyllegionaminate synthase